MQDRRRLRGAPGGERGDQPRPASAAVAPGERPPQRHAGAGGRRAARRPAPRALTTPNVVGRRCVLTRSRLLPLPCSSTSARTSSQAQRPTRTLTSRSPRPAFVDFDRRARRATAAASRSSCGQHAIGRRPRLAPEAILDDAAGERAAARARLRASEGRGPTARLRARATGQRDLGRREDAADEPAHRARTAAGSAGRRPSARYQSRLPRSESTSDRSAYARFFCNRGRDADDARCASSSVAAHAWSPIAADRQRRPASARSRAPASWTECGRNANGWTSVR